MKQEKSSVLLAAIDVSAKELVVASAAEGSDQPCVQTHANTAAGHRALLRQLKGHRVRVAMESTGVYGMGLALRLRADPRIEVMVINPRAVKSLP